MLETLRRLFGFGQVVPKHPEVATVASVPVSMGYWTEIWGNTLAQGDLLPGCSVPAVPPNFGAPDCANEVLISKADLIVVTQSCDLENRKVAFVALCPIHGLATFEQVNPDFTRKGKWEEVRQGRKEGLHLLASPEIPGDNREAKVVDFRQIVSLPFDYVTTHAGSIGSRWRLQSPYLEHFSQALARFFMRVGLPSAIPPFK